MTQKYRKSNVHHSEDGSSSCQNFNKLVTKGCELMH